MARVTVEDCLEKLSNRFSLVHLVSKRAKQLMRGAQAIVIHKDNKSIVTALREVAAGKVTFQPDQNFDNPDHQIEAEINR